CAQDKVPDQAAQLESQGRFTEASAALKAALIQKDLSNQQRKALDFEFDRLHRIRLDFPYTESALYAELKKSVKNLTREDYKQWIEEGCFDSRAIDGQRFFMVASVSNLFFRYPDLSARRLPPKNSSPLEHRYLETCNRIKSTALAEHQPFVLPKRFEVTMSVTA